MLNSNQITNRYFSWSSSINLTINRNKLLSFPGLEKSSYSNTYVEGQSLSVYKTYNYLNVDPTTGEYTVEDIDKDGNFSFPNDF